MTLAPFWCQYSDWTLSESRIWRESGVLAPQTHSGAKLMLAKLSDKLCLLSNSLTLTVRPGKYFTLKKVSFSLSLILRLIFEVAILLSSADGASCCRLAIRMSNSQANEEQSRRNICEKRDDIQSVNKSCEKLNDSSGDFKPCLGEKASVCDTCGKRIRVKGHIATRKRRSNSIKETLSDDTVNTLAVNVDDEVTGHVDNVPVVKVEDAEADDDCLVAATGKDRRSGPTCECQCCGICDRVFRHRSSLNRHTRIHTNERNFVCAFCDATFNQSANLSRHLRTHSSYKPFACDQCDKAYRQKDSLVEHKRSHTGDRPYACKLCSRRFAGNSDLRRHEKTHSGEKPYLCCICSKAFHRKSTLVTHKKTHIKDASFVCDVCSKGFRHSVSLTAHQQLHTGVKQFVCGLCDRDFLTRGSLKRHERVHTRNEIYVCPACGKSYQWKGSLKEHMQNDHAHIFSKVLPCETCGKTFSKKSKLQRHERTHMKKVQMYLIYTYEPYSLGCFDDVHLQRNYYYLDVLILEIFLYSLLRNL